jgi:N-acetylglucosaminyldiphosphoundecaprenol N-acetyl-beta-D-mannosaminyltransferase
MIFRAGPAGDRTDIRVNVHNRSVLMCEVGRRLGAHEGFALATLNLDHLVKLGQSAPFRAAYRAQDLVTADGNPIVWMARSAGRKVSLVPGADIVLPLAQLAADNERTVALFGSTEDSLLRAAEALRAKVPGLVIAARIAPAMGFDPEGAEADEILRHLQNLQVGICFIALGAPKQEIFAARGRIRAPHVGFASIGAGLDFLSGHQRRAPHLVRKLQMEWLWRMLSDPRRLAMRYIRAAAVLPGHAARSLALRRRSRQTARPL